MPKRSDPSALRFRISVGATHPLRPYIDKIEESQRPGELLELATMGLQFRGLTGQAGLGGAGANGGGDPNTTAELARQVARLADAVEVLAGSRAVLAPGKHTGQRVGTVQPVSPVEPPEPQPIIEPADPRLDALDRWGD